MSAKSDIINHLNQAKSMIDQGIIMIDAGKKDRNIIPVVREAEQTIRKANKLITEYHIKVCLKKKMRPGNAEEVCREIESVYKYARNM